MPKETVHYGPTWVVTPDPTGGTGRPYHGEELQPGQYIQSDPDLTLNWGRDDSGMFQLSIHFEHRQWKACYEENSARNPEDTDKFGIYLDLDKADIDRMIKNLKKIRRTVF